MEMSAKHISLTGKELHKYVQLMIKDPPYCTRYEQGKPKYQHYFLTPGDMTNIVQLGYDVVKLGSYAHLFCSPVQFLNWIYMLREHRADNPAPTAKDLNYTNTTHFFTQ